MKAIIILLISCQCVSEECRTYESEILVFNVKLINYLMNKITSMIKI